MWYKANGWSVVTCGVGCRKVNVCFFVVLFFTHVPAFLNSTRQITQKNSTLTAAGNNTQALKGKSNISPKLCTNQRLRIKTFCRWWVKITLSQEVGWPAKETNVQMHTNSKMHSPPQILQQNPLTAVHLCCTVGGGECNFLILSVPDHVNQLYSQK